MKASSKVAMSASLEVGACAGERRVRRRDWRSGLDLMGDIQGVNDVFEAADRLSGDRKAGEEVMIRGCILE